MKQFSCTKGRVAGLGKAHLKCIYFRKVYKIICGSVTSRSRRELAREYGCSGGGAVDPGGVSIGKKHAPLRQLVEIGGDRTGAGAHTPEPVIHVINGEEEDVGLPGLGRQGEAEKEKNEVEWEAFHSRAGRESQIRAGIGDLFCESKFQHISTAAVLSCVFLHCALCFGCRRNRSLTEFNDNENPAPTLLCGGAVSPCGRLAHVAS